MNGRQHWLLLWMSIQILKRFDVVATPQESMALCGYFSYHSFRIQAYMSMPALQYLFVINIVSHLFVVQSQTQNVKLLMKFDDVKVDKERDLMHLVQQCLESHLKSKSR